MRDDFREGPDPEQERVDAAEIDAAPNFDGDRHAGAIGDLEEDFSCLEGDDA